MNWAWFEFWVGFALGWGVLALSCLALLAWWDRGDRVGEDVIRRIEVE